MSRKPRPLPIGPTPAAVRSESVRAVLIAGDTHGETKWVRTLCKQAARYGCRFVVICGDFGWWGFDHPGFITQTEQHAAHYDTVVVWVDGNHENHADLTKLRRVAPRTSDGFIVLTPHVWYSDRGHRWRWNTTIFGSLGGARSTDVLDPDDPARDRAEGIDWWPTETVSWLDVRRLGVDPVDVLITHDAPLGVDLPGRATNLPDRYGTLANRALITEAVNQTAPRVVMHGHWHLRHSSSIPGYGREETVRIEGLADGPAGQGAAWGVLRLPSLDFADGYALTKPNRRSVT